MSIESLNPISQLLSNRTELLDLNNRMDISKDIENEKFEIVINSILGKELINPIVESISLSGADQYSYFIETTLVDYFTQNYQLLELNNGGISNDK